MSVAEWHNVGRGSREFTSQYTTTFVKNSKEFVLNFEFYFFTDRIFLRFWVSNDKKRVINVKWDGYEKQTTE